MRDASERRPSGRRTPDGLPVTSVVILDRCANLGRLLELIVREQRPGTLVRTFADAAEAERWVGAAPGPVLVIADLEVGEQAAERVAAWHSRDGRVRLVVLADPGEEASGVVATTPRPVRLDAWRVCIQSALSPAGAWHTAGTWRTPPAPGTTS
jgi:hypothetical protein